jgi:hypothetical protein
MKFKIPQDKRYIIRKIFQPWNSINSIEKTYKENIIISTKFKNFSPTKPLFEK